MNQKLKFNRMELAGSFGDFGTLLPLGLGMILINQLNPVSVFFGIGLYYLISGFYFRVTSPVEPMKVISGYAIATGIGAATIQASCLWVFLILLLIGATGLLRVIVRFTPRSVVRGVQLSTGMLLITQGLKLIIGSSTFQQLQQSAEPYLNIQQLGFLPIGMIIGTLLGIVTLLLLDNRRFPAALVIISIGLLTGVLLGSHDSWQTIRFKLHVPSFFPYGIPSVDEFTFAVLFLVLPQIPMTLGNAVIANADLTSQYFQEAGTRVTHKSLCLSMALANLGSFLIGGIPMCHGAGGLASRYRFGARTGGSNIIGGVIFLVTVLFLGDHILAVIKLLPLSALGVLLMFAGAQLGLTIIDVQSKKDLFVVLLITGITIVSNLAIAFVVGLAIAAILQWDRLSV